MNHLAPATHPASAPAVLVSGSNHEQHQYLTFSLGEAMFALGIIALAKRPTHNHNIAHNELSMRETQTLELVMSNVAERRHPHIWVPPIRTAAFPYPKSATALWIAHAP